MDCIHRIQSLHRCAHYAINGHPSRKKKDLPNFCLEKESLRLFIIYNGWEKEGVPVFEIKRQSGEGF